MSKILITGGTGLLGKAFIEGSLTNDEILATYVGAYDVKDEDNLRYLNIDIRDKQGYLKVFEEFRPDVVVHAASIGSPDFAEKNRELTWDININGTKCVSELCESFKARLIHISSNGIYDGDHAPYAENDLAKPINYYGTTKLESENVVKASQSVHAIIRPILMYGWPHPFERGNILTFALSQLIKGQTMNVYDDVYCNQLFVGQCAEAIWKIITDNKYDLYNIAGGDVVSIYDFVCQAAQEFGLDKQLVKPVKQGFFNELVKRPKNTSYDTNKMRTDLGLQPLSLLAGLRLMGKGPYVKDAK